MWRRSWSWTWACRRQCVDKGVSLNLALLTHCGKQRVASAHLFLGCSDPYKALEQCREIHTDPAARRMQGEKRLISIIIGAPVAATASCRAKRFCSRLRLSSLVPLVLGACVLMPFASPALQAKEISLQDNQGQYQPYTPGMKLPDGVFPPMKGYTHGDLIAAAQARVEAFMKAQKVDPTLIRESLIALATHLNTRLEKEGAEYQISSWYQKPYDDPQARNRSVERLGEHFGGVAVDGAADSLEGSPLLYKGREFCSDLIGAAGDGVHDLIVTLNKPGA